MEKPKKDKRLSFYADGYNKACDDWKLWLDSISVERILIAMADHHSGNHAEALKIARAIRELLRGEK